MTKMNKLDVPVEGIDQKFHNLVHQVILDGELECCGKKTTHTHSNWWKIEGIKTIPPCGHGIIQIHIHDGICQLQSSQRPKNTIFRNCQSSVVNMAKSRVKQSTNSSVRKHATS